MELEQLESAWAQQTQRLDDVEALALDAWRAPRQRAVCSRLGWFNGRQLLWLLLWIALSVIWANFWMAHRDTPQLLLTGLTLHLYGIAAIAISIARSVLASQTRANAPVVEQLTRLAGLRRFTAITELVLGLPWFCLWLLAAEWLSAQYLGIDLYRMSPPWFLSTLAVGMLGIFTSSALARWALPRLSPTHWARHWFESLSGRSLAKAQQELQELNDPSLR